MFYGIAAAVRGYLILRSGYLPRALGAIVILGELHRRELSGCRCAAIRPAVPSCAYDAGDALSDVLDAHQRR